MFVVDDLLHSSFEGTLEGAPKDAPRSYHKFESKQNIVNTLNIVDHV